MVRWWWCLSSLFLSPTPIKIVKKVVTAAAQEHVSCFQERLAVHLSEKGDELGLRIHPTT